MAPHLSSLMIQADTDRLMCKESRVVHGVQKTQHSLS